MTSKISISLPRSLEEYARSRVRTGGYGSISEYFRELVRIDQRYEVAKGDQAEQTWQRPLASAARRPPFD